MREFDICIGATALAVITQADVLAALAPWLGGGLLTLAVWVLARELKRLDALERRVAALELQRAVRATETTE